MDRLNLLLFSFLMITTCQYVVMIKLLTQNANGTIFEITDKHAFSEFETNWRKLRNSCVLKNSFGILVDCTASPSVILDAQTDVKPLPACPSAYSGHILCSDLNCIADTASSCLISTDETIGNLDSLYSATSTVNETGPLTLYMMKGSNIVLVRASLVGNCRIRMISPDIIEFDNLEEKVYVGLSVTGYYTRGLQAYSINHVQTLPPLHNSSFKLPLHTYQEYDIVCGDKTAKVQLNLNLATRCYNRWGDGVFGELCYHDWIPKFIIALYLSLSMTQLLLNFTTLRYILSTILTLLVILGWNATVSASILHFSIPIGYQVILSVLAPFVLYVILCMSAMLLAYPTKWMHKLKKTRFLRYFFCSNCRRFLSYKHECKNCACGGESGIVHICPLESNKFSEFCSSAANYRNTSRLFLVILFLLCFLLQSPLLLATVLYRSKTALQINSGTTDYNCLNNQWWDSQQRWNDRLLFGYEYTAGSSAAASCTMKDMYIDGEDLHDVVPEAMTLSYGSIMMLTNATIDSSLNQSITSYQSAHDRHIDLGQSYLNRVFIDTGKIWLTCTGWPNEVASNLIPICQSYSYLGDLNDDAQINGLYALMRANYPQMYGDLDNNWFKLYLVLDWFSRFSYYEYTDFDSNDKYRTNVAGSGKYNDSLVPPEITLSIGVPDTNGLLTIGMEAVTCMWISTLPGRYVKSGKLVRPSMKYLLQSIHKLSEYRYTISLSMQCYDDSVEKKVRYFYPTDAGMHEITNPISFTPLNRNHDKALAKISLKYLNSLNDSKLWDDFNNGDFNPSNLDVTTVSNLMSIQCDNPLIWLQCLVLGYIRLGSLHKMEGRLSSHHYHYHRVYNTYSQSVVQAGWKIVKDDKLSECLRSGEVRSIKAKPYMINGHNPEVPDSVIEKICISSQTKPTHTLAQFINESMFVKRYPLVGTKQDLNSGELDIVRYVLGKHEAVKVDVVHVNSAEDHHRPIGEHPYENHPIPNGENAQYRFYERDNTMLLASSAKMSSTVFLHCLIILSISVGLAVHDHHMLKMAILIVSVSMLQTSTAQNIVTGSTTSVSSTTPATTMTLPITPTTPKPITDQIIWDLNFKDPSHISIPMNIDFTATTFHHQSTTKRLLEYVVNLPNRAYTGLNARLDDPEKSVNKIPAELVIYWKKLERKTIFRKLYNTEGYHGTKLLTGQRIWEYGDWYNEKKASDITSCMSRPWMHWRISPSWPKETVHAFQNYPTGVQPSSGSRYLLGHNWVTPDNKWAVGPIYGSDVFCDGVGSRCCTPYHVCQACIPSYLGYASFLSYSLGMKTQKLPDGFNGAVYEKIEEHVEFELCVVINGKGTCLTEKNFHNDVYEYAEFGVQLHFDKNQDFDLKDKIAIRKNKLVQHTNGFTAGFYDRYHEDYRKWSDNCPGNLTKLILFDRLVSAGVEEGVYIRDPTAKDLTIRRGEINAKASAQQLYGHPQWDTNGQPIVTHVPIHRDHTGLINDCNLDTTWMYENLLDITSKYKPVKIGEEFPNELQLKDDIISNYATVKVRLPIGYFRNSQAEILLREHKSGNLLNLEYETATGCTDCSQGLELVLKSKSSVEFSAGVECDAVLQNTVYRFGPTVHQVRFHLWATKKEIKCTFHIMQGLAIQYQFQIQDDIKQGDSIQEQTNHELLEWDSTVTQDEHHAGWSPDIDLTHIMNKGNEAINSLENKLLEVAKYNPVSQMFGLGNNLIRYIVYAVIGLIALAIIVAVVLAIWLCISKRCRHRAKRTIAFASSFTPAGATTQATNQLSNWINGFTKNVSSITPKKTHLS